MGLKNITSFGCGIGDMRKWLNGMRLSFKYKYPKFSMVTIEVEKMF